ncbi:maleylpyruvate isomerase N-terminal domain-containing protein [Pseudonocardia sp.]
MYRSPSLVTTRTNGRPRNRQRVGAGIAVDAPSACPGWTNRDVLGHVV